MTTQTPDAIAWIANASTEELMWWADDLGRQILEQDLHLANARTLYAALAAELERRGAR